MNPAIAKRMQLIAEWKDKGFRSGIHNSQRGMDELKKKALSLFKALLVGVAAFAGLTAALMKFIKAGAEVKSVEESFGGFIRTAGMAPETLERIREATRGTIANFDLMNASVRGLAAGLDPGRIIEFWEKAKQIADVSSQSTLVVFENLVMSMTKLEVETLKTIGITIRADDVYRDYARSIGKTQAQLSTYDKTMAFSIALEQKYIENYYKVGDVTTRVREKLQQLTAGLVNLKNKFVKVVAESPSVQKFLEMLISKVGETDEGLANLEPSIQGVIDKMTDLVGKVVELGDKIKGAAEWIDKLKAPLLGLGAGIISGKIAAGILSIAAAFGAIPGGQVPAAIAAVIGLLVGLGTTAVISWNRMHSGIDDTNESLITQMDLLREVKTLSELAALQQKLFPGVTPKAPRKPGGLWEKPEESKIEAMQLETEMLAEQLDIRIEYIRNFNELEVAANEWRGQSILSMMRSETRDFRKAYYERQQAFQQSMSVMTMYSDKFYDRRAKMGRIINATLIRGYTELVASYIEAKTKQFGIDAMEYAYQAVAAAAKQQWGLAAGFAQAAFMAGSAAGAGMIGAGLVRGWGEEKAESLTAESEAEWGTATRDEEDITRQRRQASGIVNTRPISINVYSTANFNAGYMIFGDSERAVTELYEDKFRDKIEDDFESGMIAVTA